jgi:hypothetical protein
LSRGRDKEFGDFQTPIALASEVVAMIGGDYASIVEPTCGRGAFLEAAAAYYPKPTTLHGLDISRAHLKAAKEKTPAAKFEQADFFSYNWRNFFAALPEPILVLGNPPWVTNAEQGKLGGTNLPKKTSQSLKGLDARTGKSNFDVSEWMLRHLLEALSGRSATLAMLIKTSVARRVLTYAWKTNLPITNTTIYPIDAAQHFNVSVAACLFKTTLSRATEYSAKSYENSRVTRLGFDQDTLISDLDIYEKSKHLAKPNLPARKRGKRSTVEQELLRVSIDPVRWRSGIKHDAAAIMELTEINGALYNALGERVEIERDRLYPLLKATDLADGREKKRTPSRATNALERTRFLLLPQLAIGEDTATLEQTHPQTHAYLQRHRAALDRRKSSIYKRRPPFSIFGVGPYTFAPWKIAISGLHKQLDFKLIGPIDDRPVVFDDTCYFLPCASQRDAEQTLTALSSPTARAFLASLIFWDAKRPITAEVLGRLDLARAKDYTDPV